MQPGTMTNLTELTKDKIGNLYFLSVENRETKGKFHFLGETRSGNISGPAGGRSPTPPEIEADVACWYGGMSSLAHALDPGVTLPPLKEIIGYINQNFERVKTAAAA